MAHQTITWQTQDGLNVFGQTWQPEGKCKAAVCLVHGMGEHSSRYAHVAEYLNKEGIAVLAFDHRGHGKTDGKRGHAPDYDSLMSDVELALQQTKTAFPGVPIFLFGHSMGGNLVLNFALRKNPAIKGVIASAPWIRLAFLPSSFDLFMAKVMVNVYPSFTQGTGLDATAISRITSEVDKYKKDPLVHDKISPAMFMACNPAGEYILEHAEEWTLPLYIYHGIADRLTSYNASKEFIAKATGEVTWKSWEGGYHESHNDLDKAKVLLALGDWIKAHI